MIGESSVAQLRITPRRMRGSRWPRRPRLGRLRRGRV